jgi:hypothetical protein
MVLMKIHPVSDICLPILTADFFGKTTLYISNIVNLNDDCTALFGYDNHV